jgi:hypothetical protein
MGRFSLKSRTQTASEADKFMAPEFEQKGQFAGHGLEGVLSPPADP